MICRLPSSGLWLYNAHPEHCSLWVPMALKTVSEARSGEPHGEAAGGLGFRAPHISASIFFFFLDPIPFRARIHPCQEQESWMFKVGN